MNCRRLTLAVLGALLVLPAVASGGVTPVITIKDDVFDPTVPTKGTGGFTNYHWQRDPLATDEHNVRQDDKLFRSGDPTTNPAFSYTVAVSAGTFPYYCEIHGGPNGEGMHGKIKVRPGISNVTPNSFDVAWAAPLTETGNAFDVRYRVNGGNWKTWKNDTSKRGGTFGENNNPVDVKPGKTYDIEARSEKANKPKKRSDWSPAASIVIG
jgi:plastocyanin